MPSAPRCRPDRRVAGRRAAAAELVGEDHLAAAVVEGRRVPEREVRRCPRTCSVTTGCSPVGDVHQDAVAHARTGGDVALRVRRDVVAAAGRRRAVAARVCRRRGTAPACDARQAPLRRAARDLHDADLVVRRLAVGEGRARASTTRRRRRGCRPLCPGASVWVCEPHGVSTAATYCGLAGSEMSKTRTPSQASSRSRAGWCSAQESSLRLESTLRTSRSFQTEMSFCEPGQTTWATTFGWLGFADVVDHEAVVVAGVGVLALERQVAVERRPRRANAPCLGMLAIRRHVLAAAWSLPEAARRRCRRAWRCPRRASEQPVREAVAGAAELLHHGRAGSPARTGRSA